jgi:hypothetical protein
MFNLVMRKFGKNEPSAQDVNYYEQTTEGKIHILDSLLDDSFEIYHRDNGNVMLYNQITGDYIDDNGEGACNLPIFWNGLLQEHLSLVVK